MIEQLTDADERPESAAPSLATIARLVEQSLDAHERTHARLDLHIRATATAISGLGSSIDGLRDLMRYQQLSMTDQLTQMQKQSDRVEEHVGFLTQKVADHDKRFDSIDAQLAAIAASVDRLSRAGSADE